MTTKSPTQAALDASGWLVRRRDRQLTVDEEAAFGDWLRESPANVLEYQEVLVIWEQLGDVSAGIDVDALVAKSNVLPLTRNNVGEDERCQPRRGFRWGAIAATLVMAVATVTIWWAMPTADEASSLYVTALGEQRSVALEDGSVLHLNTQSSIRVAFDETRRHVELVAGEAFFDIARDSQRPFTVEAGSTVIRVVGTRFNVRKLEDIATGTVVEGEVSVQPTTAVGQAELTLLPGQQATMGKTTAPVEPEAVKLEKVVAWTERRLIFEGDTLRDIVAEFNRYNLQRLVLKDDALGEIRLTGVFGANDIESFIAILGETQGIAVVEQADGQRQLVVRNDTDR